MNVNSLGPNFGGTLIIKEKDNGKATSISTNTIREIKNKPSGLSKGVTIITNYDNWAGDSGVRTKKISYDVVVAAYEKAKSENATVVLNEADYS